MKYAFIKTKWSVSMFENFTGTAHAVSQLGGRGGWCRPRGGGESRHRPMARTRSLTVWTRRPGGQHHVNTVMSVMWDTVWDTVWDVNEEAHEASVKIQFCFGRVPIHSWTWQIFFIINHMLARTQPAQLIAQRVFALLWWEFEFLNWNRKNRQWTFEWERGGYWL